MALPSWASSVVFPYVKTTKTLAVLQRKLSEVMVLWWQLGLQLGLSPGSLDEIKSNASKPPVEEKFESMLQYWLDEGEDEYRTWGALAKAVERSGNKVLGNQVRKLEPYREGARVEVELKELTNLLMILTPSWRTFATFLGISVEVVDQIDEKLKVEDCFHRMIKTWITNSDDDKEPTFEVLCTALESHAVANRALARKILTDIDVLQLLMVSETVKDQERVEEQLKRYIAYLMEETYEEALRKGTCKVKYGHVLLLGAAEAGKTSLTRGLMNKPFQKDQGRTIVADVHTVKPATWAKAGKSYWESVEDEIEELARLMAVVKPREELAKTVRTLLAAKEFSSDHAPQIEQMVDTNKEARSRKRMELVEEAQSQAKLIVEPKVEQEVLLHVWDCGGQRVFLDVLPIFLTSRTMFLFVFNAFKGLLANEEIHGSEDSVITLDRMEQWMAMIYCQLAEESEKPNVPLRYPQIYPIGTHGDLLSQDKKEEVLGKLISHCDPKYYSTILRQPLIVDNTTAGTGEHEDEGFGTIRKAVSEMVTKELELETPVAWVLFRLLLSKLGRKIVTYTEASKVALECHISEDECQSALNFYHELGVFLFYSHISGLRDHVITDPKWLVERLGNLLRLEGSSGLGTYKTQWRKLREKGIALRSLYDEVWKKSEESDVEPSRLMDLLVTFHLASPVPPSLEHPQGSYFLPCVLKYNAHLPRLFPHDMIAASLYIVFEAQKELIKFVPPGFFIRLVTALANDRSSRYKIDFRRVHRRRIFYLRADSVQDKFTITEHPHAFEVHATGIDEDQHHFSSFCRELASALDECCTQVLSCYENHRKKMFINRKPAVEISWKFGLLCQSPRCDRRGSEHYCFFVPGKDVFANLRCEESDVPQYHDDQRYWFIEEEKSAMTTSADSVAAEMHVAVSEPPETKPATTKESDDFPGWKWEDILGLPTENERINFLKSCLILFGTSANLLRKVLQEEAQRFHRKIPEDLDEENFSSLVSLLIDPKERLKSSQDDEAFLGLFLEFASSQVSLSDTKVEESSHYYGKDWTEMKVLKWSGRLQKHPSKYKASIVNRKKSRIKPSGEDNVFYLRRGHSNAEKEQKNIEVYFGTEKYDAVDRLRVLRNENVGHPKNVSMSDTVFDELVHDVEECYKILIDDEESIQEVQKIKKDPLVEKEVLRRLEPFQPVMVPKWRNAAAIIVAKTVHIHGANTVIINQ